MSRAFVKEDVEAGELRSGRRRGEAVPRYMTAAGSEKLRARLAELGDGDSRAQIEEALATATIVQPPERPSSVIFGSTVTVQRKDAAALEVYRIVGIDEAGLAAENVSWLAPIAKALLGAEVGDWVRFPGEGNVARVIARID